MHLNNMTDQDGSIMVKRDYSKGNWTQKETMVLIEAKKMENERRIKGIGNSEARGKPVESKWKWIEDYCSNKGCHRSQNQCNDKWDNLMRDYKKVKEYENKSCVNEIIHDTETNQKNSYWNLEKNERKDKNLPTNMVLEIYEALVNVVESKTSLKISKCAASTSKNDIETRQVMDTAMNIIQPSPPLPPHLLEHHISTPILLPPSQPSIQVPSPFTHPPAAQPCPEAFFSLAFDKPENSDSPAKKRKREGEGTSASISSEIADAISKSASTLAETLQVCNDRKERRHKEMLSLHERRLKIEESKIEVQRQGINSLVDAINNLANSFSSLTSFNNDQAASK